MTKFNAAQYKLLEDEFIKIGAQPAVMPKKITFDRGTYGGILFKLTYENCSYNFHTFTGISSLAYDKLAQHIIDTQGVKRPSFIGMIKGASRHEGEKMLRPLKQEVWERLDRIEDWAFKYDRAVHFRIRDVSVQYDGEQEAVQFSYRGSTTELHIDDLYDLTDDILLESIISIMDTYYKETLKGHVDGYFE